MKKNKKNFILDGKEIRNCNSNIAKMNLIEVMLYGYSAPSIDWKKYFTSIAIVIAVPFILLFYPVVWVICAVRQRNRARKAVEQEQNPDLL